MGSVTCKTADGAGPDLQFRLGPAPGGAVSGDQRVSESARDQGGRRHVLFQRLRPDAVLPSAGSPQAAGLDLHACLDEPVRLTPGQSHLIPTGWSLACPEGVYARIAPRSGMSVKGFMINAGVVDADFRGEVKVLLAYIGDSDASPVVNPGDRVAQLVFERVMLAQAVEVEQLSSTGRGEHGWGSTGS